MFELLDRSNGFLCGIFISMELFMIGKLEFFLIFTTHCNPCNLVIIMWMECCG